MAGIEPSILAVVHQRGFLVPNRRQQDCLSRAFKFPPGFSRLITKPRKKRSRLLNANKNAGKRMQEHARRDVPFALAVSRSWSYRAEPLAQCVCYAAVRDAIARQGRDRTLGARTRGGSPGRAGRRGARYVARGGTANLRTKILLGISGKSPLDMNSTPSNSDSA